MKNASEKARNTSTEFVPPVMPLPTQKGKDKKKGLLDKLRDRDTPVFATSDAHGPG